jgi:hypothetical protein
VCQYQECGLERILGRRDLTKNGSAGAKNQWSVPADDTGECCLVPVLHIPAEKFTIARDWLRIECYLEQAVCCGHHKGSPWSVPTDDLPPERHSARGFFGIHRNIQHFR